MRTDQRHCLIVFATCNNRETLAKGLLELGRRGYLVRGGIRRRVAHGRAVRDLECVGGASQITENVRETRLDLAQHAQALVKDLASETYKLLRPRLERRPALTTLSGDPQHLIALEQHAVVALQRAQMRGRSLRVCQVQVLPTA